MVVFMRSLLSLGQSDVVFGKMFIWWVGFSLYLFLMLKEVYLGKKRKTVVAVFRHTQQDRKAVNEWVLKG